MNLLPVERIRGIHQRAAVSLCLSLHMRLKGLLRPQLLQDSGSHVDEWSSIFPFGHLWKVTVEAVGFCFSDYAARKKKPKKLKEKNFSLFGGKRNKQESLLTFCEFHHQTTKEHR